MSSKYNIIYNISWILIQSRFTLWFAFVPDGNANDGLHTPPHVVNGVQAVSINLCATDAPLQHVAMQNARPVRLRSASVLLLKVNSRGSTIILHDQSKVRENREVSFPHSFETIKYFAENVAYM